MLRSLIALALLAAAAWLAGPRRPASHGHLRGWPWLALGVGLEVLWVRGVSIWAPGLDALHWLPSLAVLPALWFVLLNRRYRGLWLLAAGACLNVLVMTSNGGLMPIAPATLQALGVAGRPAAVGATLAVSKNQVRPDSAALLAPLGDRLVFRAAGMRIACSVGDLLIGLGGLLTLAEEAWTYARRPGSMASGAWSSGVVPATGWPPRPAVSGTDAPHVPDAVAPGCHDTSAGGRSRADGGTCSSR